MRVLLTGAAGFIGTATATALDAAGHEVVRLDLMLPQAHGASEPPPGVHRHDVRTPDQWAPLLTGVDAVCHLAAVVGAGVTVADLPVYASHNDLGTAAVLAAMHAAGVSRLVLASSMVVYGEGHYTCPRHGAQQPPPRPVAALEAGDFETHCPVCASPLDWTAVDEDARCEPRSAYAVSKLAQELYAAAWARQGGGSVTALRYHNVYGPGMPRDTPYSGVAAIFRSALEAGQPPRVYEDGGQMRDFVHVADVARANLLALESVVDAEPERCAAYNVCSGRPLSILDVARRVAEGTGQPLEPLVTGQFRLGDVRHVVAAPDLARAELGFTAEVSPDEGLRAFATAPLRA